MLIFNISSLFQDTADVIPVQGRDQDQGHRGLDQDQYHQLRVQGIIGIKIKM